MAKQREGYWGYVKSMIYRYPQRRMEYQYALAQPVTPTYSGQPGGGESHRSTEDIVIAAMGRTVYREYDAVRQAIEHTETLRMGAERMEMVKLMYWRRSHNLHGCALRLHVSYATVRRWHTDFLYRVARAYGLTE